MNVTGGQTCALPISYRLSGRPALLFDLAQCERQLGHTDEAAERYREYLKSDPQGPAASHARAWLASLNEEEKRRVEQNVATALTPKPAAAPVGPAPFYQSWWFVTGAGVLVAGAVGATAWGAA